MQVLAVTFAVVCGAAVAGCGANRGANDETPRSPPTGSSTTPATRTTTNAETSTDEQQPEQRAEPGLRIDSSDRAGFTSLLRESGGRGAIAFRQLDGSGASVAAGLDAPFAWSSIKPVILSRLLLDVGGTPKLTAEQRQNARAAITASDNAAAMALFDALRERHGSTQAAAAATTEVLRTAGDRETDVSSVGRGSFSPYGQTLWTPANQTRFLAALARGCLLDRADTASVLALMNEVVPDQRWGFGELKATSAFKGGWGPDPSGAYLVRQMGLLETSNGEPVAFAAAVRAADGSFESGRALLGRVAAWADGLRLEGRAPAACD